jgi:hypothetical protein
MSLQTKNPWKKARSRLPYRGDDRSRGNCQDQPKILESIEKEKQALTWWIGGYMELVQTGHSRSSWTLVAGGISGPGIAPAPEVGTTPMLAAAMAAAADALRKGRGRGRGRLEDMASSSSMPSDDDTHSMLWIMSMAAAARIGPDRGRIAGRGLAAGAGVRGSSLSLGLVHSSSRGNGFFVGEL